MPIPAHPDTFVNRHLGPAAADREAMATAMGHASLDALIDAVVPPAIRRTTPIAVPAAASEHGAMAELKRIAAHNRVRTPLIGLGYHGTLTPPVIQRALFENPGWYTQYTPYQAEISQGRLESLLNFQTLVTDLTGLPMANASLLDEATAAAEAMHICTGATGRARILVADDCHPQTISLVRTRAAVLGVAVEVRPFAALAPDGETAGVIVQSPATDGRIHDLRPLAAAAKAAGAKLAVGTDLLALTVILPPGEQGAEIVFGNSQRFGVPLGFGGPHAAFFAVSEDLKRLMPGRLVGVSKDRRGNPAFRLALQTREQHIRREKATSNICTAQALLANMAAMYAVYHGPEGLTGIAQRIHALACTLARALAQHGWEVSADAFFDTVAAHGPKPAAAVIAAAAADGLLLRDLGDGRVAVALDETSDKPLLNRVLAAFGITSPLPASGDPRLGAPRTSPFLAHPVFHAHRSETELLRYIKGLEAKDISLCQGMIPLGSCTMKLNPAASMLPVSWPEFAHLHPFAPAADSAGYRELFDQLEAWLADITGFAAVSLQPNAGSQGEYAGILAIRAYHDSRGDRHRDICLIPASAHGTNPATAAMCGLTVVPVACDAQGNVDLADLKAKCDQHAAKLAAIMVTYPSTHGVFEAGIKDLCTMVHAAGGQVYMDGANMNAQVGLTAPGLIGADVCHLNLHKTFAIPHGGGGPGMGPIGVARHLAPFLPRHPLAKVGGEMGPEAVSAAPWGSASILPIPWMYCRMLGPDGLTLATKTAILNANWIAHRLAPCYQVLYRGAGGLVAHECIIDLRPWKAKAGIEAEDVAKRLIDYGFHAPTLSFPVAGTLMIEPTESESRAELDRFCDAMIGIHAEMQAIADGKADRVDNLLKQAPHPADEIADDGWKHPYSRRQAVFPVPGLVGSKTWAPVARVDNVWGDRNLMCICPPVSAYA